MARLRTPRRRMEPNLLPLLDVIFLVLAVFVVASMDLVDRRALGIELPASEAQANSVEEAALTVCLRSDGGLTINEEPVVLAELGSRVGTLRQEKARPVVVAGDRNVPLERVIQVLGHLQAAGIEDAALEVRRK